MEDFLYHLKMKNFQNRYAAVIENGSWGPVSGRLMKSYLENMKNITICEDMVTIRSVMKKADGQALEKLAEKVIKKEADTVIVYTNDSKNKQKIVKALKRNYVF